MIFSPKIVYGVDILMKRPVYCYYKEHTIDPRSMVQQICRNRNITEVKYLFTKQSYTYNETTLDTIKEEVKLLDQYGYRDFGIVEEYMNTNFTYLDLLSIVQYTKHCLHTNKRVHFRLLMLLEKRGFIDSSQGIKTLRNTLTKKEKKAIQRRVRFPAIMCRFLRITCVHKLCMPHILNHICDVFGPADMV